MDLPLIAVGLPWENSIVTSSLSIFTAGSQNFTRTEFHQRGRMKMGGLPKFMWLDSEKVVAESWRSAQNGKAISVPGWQYAILSFITRFGPRPMIRKIGMNVRVKQRERAK